MESRSDPWITTVLAGRYRIVARIGAGGMGVVYRAWDHQSQRYVVVKTPKRELLGDERFRLRFAQELSALRTLCHGSVVPIVDLGTEQDIPYALMPYLAGGSLKQRRPLLPDGTTAPDEPGALWRWLPAVAGALDFVHTSGYVHRDVKPDNILFDGLGTPFLGDFGVAKIVFQADEDNVTRGLTGTGFALGTPEYMAPEMISGSRPDALIDQYALAVMTYEILAGRKPFDGPTPAATMLAHATGNAPSLSSLRPSLPQSVSNAVARGMAKSPADRFESCTAFAATVLTGIARPVTAAKTQLMCPQCGRLLNVKQDWAGKQGNCPRCKVPLTIASDLKSLWMPQELGTADDGSLRASVVQLNATPSQPVRVPRLVRAPDSVPTQNSFFSSHLAQIASASLVAFALVAVTIAVWRPSPPPNTLRAKNAASPPPSVQLVGDAPPSAPPAQSDRRTTPTSKPPVITDSLPPKPDVLVGGVVAAERAVSVPSSPAAPPIEPVAESSLGQIPPAPPADEPDSTSAVDVAATAAPPPRLPEPDPGQLAEATALIRKAFEEQYAAAAKNQDYAPLIDQLHTTQEVTSDPVRRFALLVEGEQVSIQGGDLSRAIEFAKARCDLFDIDRVAPLQAVIDRFTKAGARVSPELFEQAAEEADHHLELDDFSMAEPLAALALNIAKALNREQKAAAAQAKRSVKGKSSAAASGLPSLPKEDIDAESLIKQATGLVDRVAKQQAGHAAYLAASVTLQDEPDDKAAQAAVGRYLCFMKRLWRDGLPHLAKSDLEHIATLAERQVALEGQPKAISSEVFTAAGAWWDAASDKDFSPTERDAIRAFASSLYAGVVAELTDPTEIKLAEKRSELAQGGHRRGNDSLAALVAAADQPQGQPEPRRAAASTPRSRTKSPTQSQLRIPAFTIVPKPATLSKELDDLLPTAEEIDALRNHVNLTDAELYKVRTAFISRLKDKFAPASWTTDDATYIFALRTALGAISNENASFTKIDTIYVIKSWILSAPNPSAFIDRVRAIPQPLFADVSSRLRSEEVKSWLIGLGETYKTSKSKAAALDKIVRAGITLPAVAEIKRQVDAALE